MLGITGRGAPEQREARRRGEPNCHRWPATRR